MMHRVNDCLAWGDVWSVEEAGESFDSVLNVGRPMKEHALPGVEYKLMYFDDVDPFPYEDMWECVLWIDERISAGKKVYVHCYYGNSRSVSTVIAYLHHQGMDFDAACDLLLSIKSHETALGEYIDKPLAIRDWFRRDWPEFAKGKGVG